MPGCIGGPPCNTEFNDTQPTIAANKILKAKYTGLTRNVLSTDFGEILILDSAENIIMKYDREMVANSDPAMYSYKLKDEDAKLLATYTGQIIQIKNIESRQKLSNLRSYRLVKE